MGNSFSVTDEDDKSTLSTSFGPSIPSGRPIEAASLRREARELMSEAKQASKESQYEYHSGCKSQAKILSIRKTNLYKQINDKNQRAAKLIFEHQNRNRSNDSIDLHGLYVAEALEYLKRRLNECRLENLSKLTVITGMGNNSPNRIAKLKPEVEKFVRENRLKMIVYPGHVVVDLAPDNPCEITNYQDTNSYCIIL